MQLSLAVHSYLKLNTEQLNEFFSFHAISWIIFKKKKKKNRKYLCYNKDLINKKTKTSIHPSTRLINY